MSDVRHIPGHVLVYTRSDRVAGLNNDGIYDPIQNPISDRSMLIGGPDSLRLGDYVDIYSYAGGFQRRLAASPWNLDRGRLLWDGVIYNGELAAYDTPGDYYWRKNEEATQHPDTLRLDVEPPSIGHPFFAYGPGTTDTLKFDFSDADTHAGRVRATVYPAVGGTPISRRFIFDQFYRDTQGPNAPLVAKAIDMGEAGWWKMILQVWDVGIGPSR